MAGNLPREPAAEGVGHRETGTSLREWVEGGVDRCLAAEVEWQQSLAWSQVSGLRGAAGEARAFLAEDLEVQETGSAVQGAMGELSHRGTGCRGLAEGCWGWVGERLPECPV